MAFDFSKLLGKVKLNNKVPWKTTEIVKAMELLNIDSSDVSAYFFKK